MPLSYDEEVLADSPALFWRTISTTVATDASGNGRNGTAFGSPAATVASPVTEPAGDTDTGIDLDGVNDRYTASSYTPAANGTVRTWEGWFKRDGATDDALFMSSVSAGPYSYVIGASRNIRFWPDGSLSGAVAANRAEFVAAFPNDTGWHHIVIKFDEPNNTCDCWVDGVKQTQYTGLTAQYNASPGAFNIGTAAGASNGVPLDGKAAKIAVYEGSLSEARIAAHWDARDADLVPPNTTIDLRPDDPSASLSATFVFHADEAATFEARLDGGSWATVTSPHSFNTTQGDHTWEVRAIDTEGNVDATPASWTWTVDYTVTAQSPSHAVLRLQALDGTWETCGQDRYRGVTPENLQLSSNLWGPDTCSFVLRRDPGAVHPDLSAYTPCEVEIGGHLVWSGRVWETPSRDGQDAQIAVEGRGWQYHLDDDVYQRSYVHTRLSDWKDARDFVDTDLASYVTGFSVRADGAITLEVPSANTVANGTLGGVVLDTGDDQGVKRVVVTYRGGGAANLAMSVYQASTPTGVDESFTVDSAPIATALTTAAFTFTTPRRYVQLVLVAVAGVTGSATSYARVESVKVFRDTAYEAGNESVLTFDTIAKDARDAATVLLSSSNDLVEAQTFPIPEAYLDSQRTPREVLEAFNAYENCQVGVDVRKRLVVREKPSVAVIEVGEWAGSEFEDASANSGEEIYNRVVVEGEGPDGAKLTVDRASSQLAGVALSPSSSPAANNPTFATDTASWTPTTSTITRDTGTFDTTPASGRWDNTGASDILTVGDTLVETFAGTFLAGVVYTLSVAIKASSTLDTPTIGATFGVAGNNAVATWKPTTGFVTYSVVWTPSANRTGVTLSLRWNKGSAYVNIDSVSVLTAQPTLVDRHGFRRTKILPVGSAGTDDSYTQIGDLYLAGHRTTPLKGTLKITGTMGARRVLGGQGVHPSELLVNTGEMIRLAHRIDPDTGAIGRDGRIATVAYNHDQGAATAAIDNERGRLEALLARLAVVTGQL